MDTKDTRITIRVDKDLKDRTSKELDKMGLNISTVFTMLLKQIDIQHQIPFDIVSESPSESSMQAIEDVKNGNVESFDSVKEWWESLNNEN